MQRIPIFGVGRIKSKKAAFSKESCNRSSVGESRSAPTLIHAFSGISPCKQTALKCCVWLVVPLKDLPDAVTTTQRLMAEASAIVLEGFALRTSIKIVSHPDRIEDHRGIAIWNAGMTELGDAELTEQGGMSLSDHRTPDAARGYVKKTDAQRLTATRKRHAWVQELEHSRNKSQSELRNRESD